MPKIFRIPKGSRLTYQEGDDNNKYPYLWTITSLFSAGMLVFDTETFYLCIQDVTTPNTIPISDLLYWKPVGGGGGLDIYGFNTVNGTKIALGGIPQNTLFPSNKLCRDILYDAMNPFINPSIGFGITSPKLNEKGTTVASVSMNYSISPQDGVVLTRTLKRNATTINSPISNGGSYTDSGLSITYATLLADRTWSFSVTYSNYGAQSGSDSIRFIAPSYFGVGSSTLLDAVTTVGGLTTALPSSKSLKESKGGITVTNPTLQRYYYVYPAALGDLTKILDQNGFDVTASYVKTTQNITLNDGVTVEIYNVYKSTSDTTQSNFTQTYI